MNSRGFSLTELLVVIVLISIVTAISSISFNAWQKKYNIEGQVKEMLVDLSDVRQMAIQTKKEHRVILNPTAFVFRRFSSEFDALGTQVFSKSLKYPIQKFSTTTGALSSFSNTTIVINERGLTSSEGDQMTIAVGIGQGDPAYDCLAIHWARVNMGKINGNTCEFK